VSNNEQAVHKIHEDDVSKNLLVELGKINQGHFSVDEEISLSDFKILTFSGAYVSFVNPRPEDIRIIDLAHGLSNECRYSGQCRKFYPVAQHCVIASYIVPNTLAKEALFHDATEAYLKDLPTWLKKLLPGYKLIEEAFDVTIRQKFGLPMDPKTRAENKKLIKEADYKLLATEKRDLMPQDNEDWIYLRGVSPMPFTIEPWTPEVAKQKFLERYEELKG